MKKLVIAAALAFAGVCSAAQCQEDTLTAYGLLGPAGCEIGSEYQVRDFNYLLLNLAANNIDADDVLVTPSLSGGAPALTFSANWFASGVASSYTGLIEFTMASTGAQLRQFTGTNLSTDQSITGGLATAQVLEVNCLGGLLPNSLLPTLDLGGLGCLGGGVTANLGTLSNLVTSNTTANITYAPVFEIDVVKQFELVGALFETSSMSSITQSFDVTEGVPEPSTLGLAGLAFAALAARKYSRSK